MAAEPNIPLSILAQPAFGQLLGLAGVLLALPLCAAFLAALRHLRTARAASPLYNGD